MQVGIYDSTFLGFMRGLLLAYGPLCIMATTAIFCLLWLPSGGALAVWWLGLPAMVLASCAVHEAGHMLAARMYGLQFRLMASPGCMAVAYDSPSNLWSSVIAFCGPLTVLALYIGVSLLVTPLFLKFVFVATAGVHLLSLLPFTADGKTIWKYEKQTASN